MAKTPEQYTVILNKAMNICSRQEKCISDISKKLSEWKADPGDSEKIIMHLIRERYIDETRYAKSFARHKFLINKWGKIKIKFQLQKKNIKEENIQEALDLIDEQEYIDTLTQVLSAKRKNIKGKNIFDIRARLSRYAYSKGFEYELINKALDIILVK